MIRFNEVESVEFERYAGGQGSTRNFDLRVTLKASAVSGAGQAEYTFSGIDRSDYTGLYNFLSGKNIRIKNLQEPGIVEAAVPVYNEDEIYGGPDDDMGEESEDEDYDEKAAAQDQAEAEGSDSEEDDDEDLDSDDFGSEVDDELDSDLEEARGGGGKKKKKKKSADSDDDSDMIIDDLPKKKKRKKDAESPGKGKKKAKKDPNAPKRASNAYIIFSNENRDRIREENPGAKMGDISKLLGEEYKKLGKEELAELEKKVSKNINELSLFPYICIMLVTHPCDLFVISF